MSIFVDTLWITRTYNDTPELIEAWDHFSIEENPDGWEEAKKKALASVEADLRDSAVITLVVPENPIFDALYPEHPPVAVSVAGGQDEATE